MQHVAAGTIELTWDAETRVAVLRFTEATRATGDHAAVLVKAMRGWVGTTGAPFALLGDGAGLVGLDAQYRALWGEFFREHRDACAIAFFHMGALVRVAAEMFRIGTGVQLKAFADEVQARSWLRERGFRT